MKETQKAFNEWKSDEGSCKIFIELKGEVEQQDIYEQWKGIMSAIGYNMKDFDKDELE